jgi:hypothetical protein
VQIWYSSCSRYVGVYKSQSDAINAYAIAEKLFGSNSTPQDTTLIMNKVRHLIKQSSASASSKKGLTLGIVQSPAYILRPTALATLLPQVSQLVVPDLSRALKRQRTNPDHPTIIPMERSQLVSRLVVPDLSHALKRQQTNPDHHTLSPSVLSQDKNVKCSKIIAHLGDNFHRGNVIMTRTKSTTSFETISRDQADMLPCGQRGQRKRLLYHAGFKGFVPEEWQVVVMAQESVRLELAPLVNGAPPTIVDIKRAPLTTHAKLFDITATAIDEHNMLRKDDGVGGMVGIGDHLGFDGDIHPFAIKNKHMQGKLAHYLHFASMQFADHFAGCDVGWEDMLSYQAELWPNPKPKSAKCWAASQDLGNSCHTDRDNSRSFAVWLRAFPDGCVCAWWFLFPEHGVAVELAHGTWMSWDGREQPHCSAVPCVPKDDRLLSLFAHVPFNLCSVLEREQVCGDAIMARQAQDLDSAQRGIVGLGSKGVFCQLHIGTPVMLRWVPEAPANLGRMGKKRWGQSHFRWIKCKVVSLDRKKKIVEVQEVASPYWVHPQLFASQVYNGLVIGHH